MQHKARKRFGQNFLVDQQIIARIIQLVHPSVDDTIIEIGPGKGAITSDILATQAHITAIEIDKDLAQLLQKRFVNQANFTLYQADALQVDISKFSSKDKKVRIVGNLPYNISTPLIFHLLSSIEYIKDMHFMLQHEVVERMAAPPGTKTYGRLSVMVQYHCAVTPLLAVPPNAFSPAPEVNSSFVRLVPQQPPIKAEQYTTFAETVKLAFSQRRKTIANNLKNILPSSQLEIVGINQKSRAEQLTVQDFIHISNLVSKYRAKANL